MCFGVSSESITIYTTPTILYDDDDDDDDDDNIYKAVQNKACRYLSTLLNNNKNNIDQTMLS